MRTNTNRARWAIAGSAVAVGLMLTACGHFNESLLEPPFTHAVETQEKKA